MYKRADTLAHQELGPQHTFKFNKGDHSMVWWSRHSSSDQGRVKQSSRFYARNSDSQDDNRWSRHLQRGLWRLVTASDLASIFYRLFFLTRPYKYGLPPIYAASLVSNTTAMHDMHLQPSAINYFTNFFTHSRIMSLFIWLEALIESWQIALHS